MNDPEYYWKAGYRNAITSSKDVCVEALRAFYERENANGKNDDVSRGIRDGLVVAMSRIRAALTILRAEKEREWNEETLD